MKMPKSRNRSRSRDLRRKMKKKRLNQQKRIDEMIKAKGIELMNQNKVNELEQLANCNQNKVNENE